jgi:hypothetical protein
VTRMTDLVQVESDFRPSVALPNDFFSTEANEHFVSHYIPTEETLDIFMILRDSLQPGSEERAHIFHGTYGTGKSDLMLMIANYLTRDPDEPLLRLFFQKLQNLNSSKAEAIRQARQGKPPFLLILLQADAPFTFSSFILDGLAKALEKEQLAHLMVKTNYRAAIEQIQKWRDHRSSRNYETLQNILEQEHGTTPEGLERDLAGPQADYAFHLFRDAVEKVTDMPFHPRDVVQRPADAFEEVIKQLDLNKYSGIYIICDEFSHLLQQLAESPTGADSKAIDNLAERAARSKSQQIHFTVVSLLPFTSAGTQGATQLARQSLERSGGRFRQHPLRSLDVEELIKHSITKIVSPVEIFRNAPSSQLDDLLELTMTLWQRREERRRSREWLRETVVYGAFPLHPLATYCLPRLNKSLAQNERTMFGFLKDEEHGLAHFISHTTVEPANTGYISLMSLAELFEYFEPNLEEKNADLIVTYKRAGVSLGSELLAQDAYLMDKILKALVLLDVVGDPGLHTDRMLIRHAVGLPQSMEGQIDRALEQLEQAYAVYKDHAERYRLILPGQANPLELKKQIEQRSHNIEPSPLEKLNSLHGLEPLTADTYNRERGTSRQLAARFTTLNSLGNPTTFDPLLQNEDGLAWYVLASSEQEISAARTEAVRITRENDRIVVAVPHKPTDLVVRFLRKRALEDLRSHSQDHQTQDAQDLLSDTGQVGKDCITAFQRAYQVFQSPHEFDWYYRGRQENVRFPMDEIATTVMKEVFPKTPSHSAGQHLKNSTSRAIREAMDRLLQAPFSLSPPGKGKKAPQDMILRQGAEPLGLIKHVEKANGYDEFTVVIPTRAFARSQEIWQLLEETLKKGDSWQSVVTTLKARPYGLYSSVLQLFFAAFYRYNRESLEVCEANKMELRPIDVTASIVEQMVQSPEKYIVIYQPLTKMQRRFLRSLAERAFSTRKQGDTQKPTRSALKRYAAEMLIAWGKQVPAMLRQATLDDLADLAMIVSDQPADALQAAIVLIRASQMSDIPMIASILLEELPGLLGLSAESNSWEDAQIEQALALLESICSALQSQNFFQHFQSYMTQQVGSIFGLEIPHMNQSDVLTAILSWKDQVASKVSLHMLTNSDARDLVSVVGGLDTNSSFEEAFLNDLPGRLMLQGYKFWNSMDTRDTYLQRLQTAKAFVESVASTINKQSFSSPFDNIIQAQSKQPSPPPALLNAGQRVGEEKAQVSTNITASAPSVEKPAAAPAPSKPATSGEHATATTAQAPVSRPSPVATEKPLSQPPSPNGTDTTKSEGTASKVELAFSQVKLIFNSLMPEERKVLLQKLQLEYGPR